MGSEGDVSDRNVRCRIPSQGKLRTDLTTVVWGLFNETKLNVPMDRVSHGSLFLKTH